MIRVIIYVMIALGSLLMVWNIISYVRYARAIQGKDDWGRERQVLYIPIFLLVLFLFGYLAVGFFGKPDLIIAGILFGGSIFVFLIFWVLERITQRIQTNERLEAKLLAAETSSRAKSAFLASVSHEMRTPMNAILGLNAMAMKDDALPTHTRENLEKVEVSAKHLLGLINNVLDINDIESGKLALQPESFSLRNLMGKIDTMISLLCADKGIRYESAVLDAPEDWYCGDDHKLERLLLLLLENAVKFTDAGGAVRFTAQQLAAEGDTRTLRFVVEDTGIGVDRNYLPHIFEVFAREDDSATGRFGGSGLGLPLAKAIAELMDGDITAESDKGKGSRFTVTVKVGPGTQPESAAVTAAPEESGVSLEGRRVLVVEDFEINADIIMDLLETEGTASDWAKNGQEAVDLFSASPPGYYDAILMDLRMPVMDGITATRTIRALDREDAKAVPILALTANAQEEDKKNTREAGMNAHLAKPADAELLFSALRDCLTHREQDGNEPEKRY